MLEAVRPLLLTFGLLGSFAGGLAPAAGAAGADDVASANVPGIERTENHEELICQPTGLDPVYAGPVTVDATETCVKTPPDDDPSACDSHRLGPRNASTTIDPCSLAEHLVTNTTEPCGHAQTTARCDYAESVVWDLREGCEERSVGVATGTPLAHPFEQECRAVADGPVSIGCDISIGGDGDPITCDWDQELDSILFSALASTCEATDVPCAPIDDLVDS